MYSGCAWFESQPGIRLSRLTVFVGFLSPSPHPGKSAIITRLRQDHLRLNTSQLCIHHHHATQSDIHHHHATQSDTGNVITLTFRFNKPHVSCQSTTLRYVTLRYVTLTLISDFRRDDNDICALLGYYMASYGNYLPTFRDNVSDS